MDGLNRKCRTGDESFSCTLLLPHVVATKLIRTPHRIRRPGDRGAQLTAEIALKSGCRFTGFNDWDKLGCVRSNPEQSSKRYFCQ